MGGRLARQVKCRLAQPASERERLVIAPGDLVAAHRLVHIHRIERQTQQAVDVPAEIDAQAPPSRAASSRALRLPIKRTRRW